MRRDHAYHPAARRAWLEKRDVGTRKKYLAATDKLPVEDALQEGGMSDRPGIDRLPQNAAKERQVCQFCGGHARQSPVKRVDRLASASLPRWTYFWPVATRWSSNICRT